MIQVVHVISDLDAGGAEVMLAKLVGRMDRNKFSNSVVSLTDCGPVGKQIESLGVAVHTLGMKRGQPGVGAVFRLIRLLRTLKPAIVQSWLYHADILSTVTARFSRSPILIWNVRCSDMDLNKYPPLTRLVQRVLAWWSAVPAAVIVNSEAGKRQHERLGYQPRRWDVIPNGFDTQRFRPDSSLRLVCRKEWQVADDAVVVALVARVDPMKDHATFLKAAQQIVRARDNAYFILVGRGTETLSSDVAAKGLRGRVRLLGYRDDVEHLLPGADVACLSSAFGEGFPNVLGEAMACGIPCVSTDVGDARKIIGATGRIVPVCDPTGLANAVIDLIDRGRAERESLGSAARERIEAEYSLSAVVDRYCALYSELAGLSARTS